jgi:hypothetical protein
VGTGKATLRELQEYYSLEDAYIMAEIVQVDNYNETEANKPNGDNS